MSRGERNGSESHRGPGAKARFVKWEIVEPKGSDPHILTDLVRTTIKFSVQLNEPLRRAVHGIALYNHDRQLIWGWAAYNFQVDVGLQEFHYSFPILPLRAGPYNWLVSLYEDDVEVDTWDCVPEMIVATETFQHRSDEWNGILNIPSEFAVMPQASTVPTEARGEQRS
jgi:hypothetical protein